jgi:hypothetical protein
MPFILSVASITASIECGAGAGIFWVSKGAYMTAQIHDDHKALWSGIFYGTI